MEKTKVFISWSQDRSKYVAETVKWWLKQVIQASDPWVSSVDIDAGTRSMNEIEASLANTKFGIICVTPENVEKPWLNYEAGALSKQVDEVLTRVVPLLFDFKDKADVHTPVGQFHAVLADKEGFEQIAQSLNKCLPIELQRSDEDVRATHEAWWPKLKDLLDKAPNPRTAVKPPVRSSEDMIREVVNTVRDLDSKIEKLLAGPTYIRGSDGLIVSTSNPDWLPRNSKRNNPRKAGIWTTEIRETVEQNLPADVDPRDAKITFDGETVHVTTTRDLSELEISILMSGTDRTLGLNLPFAFRTSDIDSPNEE